MGQFYQQRDVELADYELWSIDRDFEYLRGPRPMSLSSSEPNFVAYFGAAQTFGAMCRYPFPNLISSMAGVEALNLGVGAASPALYLRRKDLLELTRHAKCAIVQVMSARASENRMMVNPVGRGDLRWRHEPSDTPLRRAIEFYKELIDTRDENFVLQLVHETRETWIEEYRKLANLIQCPKILVWIGKRSPDYQMSVDSVHALFGRFPQLVDRESFDAISKFFNLTVEATYGDENPPPLLNRFTGQRGANIKGPPLKLTNTYYPSQREHIEVALALQPIIEKYTVQNSSKASAKTSFWSKL
ncbi:MAG: DUF6473 family protein [Pseudomonadota bacterium]